VGVRQNKKRMVKKRLASKYYGVRLRDSLLLFLIKFFWGNLKIILFKVIKGISNRSVLFSYHRLKKVWT
jgi:hypothetical protein